MLNCVISLDNLSNLKQNHTYIRYNDILDAESSAELEGMFAGATELEIITVTSKEKCWEACEDNDDCQAIEFGISMLDEMFCRLLSSVGSGDRVSYDKTKWELRLIIVKLTKGKKLQN